MYEHWPAGACLLYEGILSFLGIPPDSNYVDADTIRRLEHAQYVVEQYWTENGWGNLYQTVFVKAKIIDRIFRLFERLSGGWIIADRRCIDKMPDYPDTFHR